MNNGQRIFMVLVAVLYAMACVVLQLVGAGQAGIMLLVYAIGVAFGLQILQLIGRAVMHLVSIEAENQEEMADQEISAKGWAWAKVKDWIADTGALIETVTSILPFLDGVALVLTINLAIYAAIDYLFQPGPDLAGLLQLAGAVFGVYVLWLIYGAATGWLRGRTSG